MIDGREKRIANDIQLVFMGRTMERLYGPESVDLLVKYQNKKTRKNWEKRAKECGRQDPGYLLCLFNKDAHDFEVVRNKTNCLEVKVTKCVHAEVFRSFNAADLGGKLICSGDHAVVEGYNPKMTFRRPSTCMTGKCCHFIFELKSDRDVRMKKR